MLYRELSDEVLFFWEQNNSSLGFGYQTFRPQRWRTDLNFNTPSRNFTRIINWAHIVWWTYLPVPGNYHTVGEIAILG